MNVFASVAVTRDGALDDCSAQRLRISSDEDWQSVVQLRAHFDAILVGASTVRHDNPSLRISDLRLREERTRRGQDADIVKVTFTRTGHLDPQARFFTCGNGRKIVFSCVPLPHLATIAEVIVAERISAARIVTELERRGLKSLFVEGGVQTLRMFFAERMVDTLRMAVTQSLHVADADAPRLHPEDLHFYACATSEPSGQSVPTADDALGLLFGVNTLKVGVSAHTEQLGSTLVTTYRLSGGVTNDDVRLLREATDQALRCTPDAGAYCVGAVVVTRDGDCFTGFTHETSPTHHAEQEAVLKALVAGAVLRGATIYSSMEPCSMRQREKESCSAMLLRLGFARVIFALYEPDCFVCCRGALNLRESGVEVRVVPELGDRVRQANRHLNW